jgi:hypothetical protein
VVVEPERRMTLATTGKPCMSMPGAPPRMISIRSTLLTGMRRKISSRLTDRVEATALSIRTLPALPVKPRVPLPPLKLKPGRRPTMSRALAGLESRKKPAP